MKKCKEEMQQIQKTMCESQELMANPSPKFLMNKVEMVDGNISSANKAPPPTDMKMNDPTCMVSPRSSPPLDQSVLLRSKGPAIQIQDENDQSIVQSQFSITSAPGAFAQNSSLLARDIINQVEIQDGFRNGDATIVSSSMDLNCSESLNILPSNMHNFKKEDQDNFDSNENTNSTFVGQEFENIDEKPVVVIEEESKSYERFHNLNK